MKLHDPARRAAILAMHKKLNCCLNQPSAPNMFFLHRWNGKIQALLLQARQHCVPPAQNPFWMAVLYQTRRGGAAAWSALDRYYRARFGAGCLSKADRCGRNRF